MNTRLLRGFSLIELMITIAILGVLTMLALPSFGRWITNTRVRNMAESIQNGLRLAQREAASRNGSVSFVLTAAAPPSCTSTASTSGTNWVICSGTTVIERGIGQAGSTTAVVAADFSSVSFDGLGRTDLGGSSQVAVTSSSGACETSSAAGIRCLNVLISPGGKVRLCDPLLTAGDPGACS
ncbi:MAG: GspH/FimT family pseudopilin [Propionivibrio sp.]